MEETLTRGQKQALECMLSGKNTFITGEAGTGKSFIVNKFIDMMETSGKNVLISAPTGIAAINVGGVTLHRCFQAKLEPLINKFVKSVPQVVQEADIIIIDEISMCRIDLFDYVARVIAMAEQKSMKRKQLIVIGDFFQLPPVSIKDDVEILRSVYPHYEKGYAFESDNWKDFDFHHIYLKDAMRQKESEFIKQLNKARIGDDSCVQFFNRYASMTRQEKGITLCSTNKKADEINNEELHKIKEKKKKFKAAIEGEVKASDKATSDVVEVKIGARVIILINDTEEFLFQNGSLGEIVAYSKDSVDVKLDINDKVVTIHPHTWKIEKYDLQQSLDDNGNSYHKIKKQTIGKYIQLPIKLAYAITMHKSQGQTYEKVNLMPHSFDCGQLYVALSRVKSLEGLSLLQSMRKEYLICSQKVRDFYDIEIEMDEATKEKMMKIGKEMLQLDERVLAKCPEEVVRILDSVK